MFSVEQKRNIADKVQQILRDTGHPELPTVGEINFTLYVEGRVNWSWANIRNNAAVPIPSVNPHNEAQVQNCTPANPQHSREPDKVKSLAQYLDEYIEHEAELGNLHHKVAEMYAHGSWRELLEQALDAYESTEQVRIRIERV